MNSLLIFFKGLFHMKINMRNKLFVTFFISTFQLSIGQTYKLEGEILDKSNKSPLVFANIMLEGTSAGSASDNEGRFSIENIEKGSYTIIATYMGYSTYKQEITIPYTESDKIIIFLEPEAIQLEEYVVTASRRRERIEDAPPAISYNSKKRNQKRDQHKPW